MNKYVKDGFFFLSLLFLIGTLKKQRRRRKRGHGKTKDIMSRTIARHVRFKLCTFLSRPLQNNVKSSKFAWSEK